MAVSMLITAALTISVPWCRTLQTVWIVTFAQSILLGLLERGIHLEAFLQKGLFFSRLLPLQHLLAEET